MGTRELTLEIARQKAKARARNVARRAGKDEHAAARAFDRKWAADADAAKTAEARALAELDDDAPPVPGPGEGGEGGEGTGAPV